MPNNQLSVGECIGTIGVNAFAVYVCLVTNANEYLETTISYDAMQEQLKLSRGTISHSIKILISHRLIQMRRRFSQSSVYRISPPSELIDSPLVHLANCISPTSGRFNSLSLTTTIYKESVKRETNSPFGGLMDTTTSPPSELMTKNRAFTLVDAQDLLTELTSWIRIPGNPEQATHALGIIQDIHDKHNSGTKEYLRPYWEAFRSRYPRSTQLFWLTDWAVQGVIPNRATDAPKKETIFDRERRRFAAEEAAQNGKREAD